MNRLFFVSLRGKRSNPLRTWEIASSLSLLAMTIVSWLLTACAPVPIPTSDATPTPRTTPTKTIAAPGATPSPVPTDSAPQGGTITIGVIGNSNLEINAMPAVVQDALFDSLLQVDPTSGALKPALAESYQVSGDAMTITFRLRSDVRWHNGDPFTADDVVATIKAFSSSDFRGKPATDFGTFTRATALDSQTVQLTFSEGYCPALTSIGTLKILPRAVVASPNFPYLAPAQMIGTGPLRFVSRSEDQFVLERNADYYRGAPHVDSWTIRVFTDPAALRTAFAAKQVDAMTAAPGEYSAIKKIADANILATDSSEVIALMFNLDTTTLNDPRVRQALTYALDRNILLDDIGGQATSVDTSALPGYWAYPANLPRYSFDVAKAKQLLADAGWRENGDGILKKNNKPMRLELWTEADDPILEPLAFRIREMYSALGIQVELQLDDRSGWIVHAFQHRFDLLLLSRKIPLDPDQRWYWQSNQNEKGNGFNFGSYVNARVDGLLKDSLRVGQCDATARAALSGEMHRTLVADAPAAFLFAPKKYLVARDRVLGLVPSSFAGDFWNINDWRVKP